VLVARHEDRHPLALAAPADPPAHPEALRDVALERRGELLRARAEAGAELHAHEEVAPGGIRRVLIRVDDVGAVIEQERRHGRDDPGAVAARDEEPAALH
jgi:hypothetical protein